MFCVEICRNASRDQGFADFCSILQKIQGIQSVFLPNLVAMTEVENRVPSDAEVPMRFTSRSEPTVDDLIGLTCGSDHAEMIKENLKNSSLLHHQPLDLSTFAKIQT